MTSPPLIIAATRLELEPLLNELQGSGGHDRADWKVGEPLHARTEGGRAVTLAALGVGKVNTAAGLALLIGRLRPAAVIQTGIAGAYPASGLQPGEAAVASEEIHLDLGARTPAGFEDLSALGFPLLELSGPTGEEVHAIYNRVPVSETLSRELAGDRLRLLPFGTSETVSGSSALASEFAGRFGAMLESMEGAAAAQVCLALGVPFAEVRGVSNHAGERDKAEWRIGEALRSATAAVSAWLNRVDSAGPSGTPRGAQSARSA